MQEGRRGDQAPAAADATAAADRRPSLGVAALASLKGLGAKAAASVTGGRRASRVSTAAAAAGGPQAPRRGSLVPGALGAADAAAAADGRAASAAGSGPAGSGAAAATHPGLGRIKSFSRRRSVFRAGTGGGASLDDLCATMDELDARISGALRSVREQNAAGLGRVRGLAPSKSGRLQLGACAKAAGGREDEEAYSPRQLLGAEAAERPGSFLPRVKFNFKEQPSPRSPRPAGEQAEGGGGSSGGEGADAGSDSTATETEHQGEAPGLIAAVRPPAEDEGQAQAGQAAGPQPAQLRPLGARWGATEGGLDRLGWVRSLVRFGDFRMQQQQQQQLALQAAEPGTATDGSAAPTAGGGVALDTIGWLESGAGLRPATGAAGAGAASAGAKAVPAVRSREDVALLQAWLQDMMGQVVAQATGQPDQAAAEAAAAADGGAAAPAPGPEQQQDAAKLADAALWLYGMAFEEVQRQVAGECGDRAALLGGMWQHVFGLVELRCALVYESIIAAIRGELAAARRRAAAAAQAAQSAEERARESVRDKYDAMDAEVKSLAQLLGTAEDEASRHAEEAALLRRSNDALSAQRADAEARAAEELRLRLDLQHEKEELEAAAGEQGALVATQRAELAALRSELQRARADGLALAEDKARLEVEVQRVQRDYQASEIMGLSLREQLSARDAELSALSAAHSTLQAEQAAASAQLLESQASLGSLQLRHDSLQASSTERVAQLEAALAAERGALGETQLKLATAEAERAALEERQQETVAREVAVTAQLTQLSTAHEQQAGKLRQEMDARRNCEDELAAIRAGLQATQRHLEGLGLVFASAAAHRTAAEAWRATGPISMARQARRLLHSAPPASHAVVAVVNQQLGELAVRRAELQHELGAARERWQSEEAVRVRLQEQLLETKARECQLGKEREGLEGAVARLEAQRAGLDAELAQMRRMLEEAELRCQASHRAGMEAANEAKRLAPMEPRVARLEEALHAAGLELERVQREVTSHQQSIRKLLDEKGAALEQLTARSQALDAAQLQIRELAATSRDRLQLAQEKMQMEEELHELRQRCSATERLQGESMHQLTVARRLLADAASADERARLAAAQQELQSSKAAAAAHRRESVLLKDRLEATEGQLHFMEKQLQVAVHSPLAAAMAAATSGDGGAAGVGAAVAEQLQRLLATKEDRIRQLERLQGSLTTSASQMKQLKGELAARDVEVAELRAEESQAKTATKDLVALAAADPGLPPQVAQARALAVDYARSHLRSELSWTKAKLAVVCHMASGLRAKLQQAQAERAQAEMGSVCVEAWYLEQALMDQRAFAAGFDATFVKRMLMGVLTTLAELRRHLVAPAGAGLSQVTVQVDAMLAALGGWVERYSGRTDQASSSCQADPLAEVQAWQASILASLPVLRPTSPPPLQHVCSLIAQVYAHRVRQLPLQGPAEEGALADNVYEAMAQFFCERRGFSREAALSPTGPVAALLAGARSHLQQPRPLLLGRLAGLVPSGGSGSSRSLQHPAAWQFFVRLLCCLRALQGAGWEPLIKVWVEGEEGVPLPLPCVMNVLANLYNTDAPALLDSMRRALVPLVRQGRRGPAVDLDAMLLVLLDEYCDGRCPISPLALPRRLTDGATASAAAAAGSSAAAALASSVSCVAAAVVGTHPGVAAGAKHPMRRRLVNLTAAADGLALAPAGPALPRSASPSRLEPAAADGLAQQAGGSRAGGVLSGMQSLIASNPALPVGLHSQMRTSSPTAGAPGGGM